MFKPTITDEDIERLQRERDEADRAYNEALTALDRVVQHPPQVAGPPPVDEGRAARLARAAQIIADPPYAVTGWKGRLAGFVWRLIGPMLQRQQEFNGAVAEVAARAAGDDRAARDATSAALHAVQQHLALLEGSLIAYLQQITAYVDTKDRDAIGRLHQFFDQRTMGLAAGLSGLGNELAIRAESAEAREQRYQAAQNRAMGDVAELQTRLALIQQASTTLKREVERALATAPTGGASAGTTHAGGPTAPTPTPAAGGVLDSYKYVGFEDQFRGSEDEIRARFADYLPLFDGASDVLDLGCGRGEFLDLLREKGVAARGVDVNHEMVEACRRRGLAAEESGGLEYLRRLPDGSLGGLFAAQVVEHLQPDYLMQLLAAAYDKLRPGSRIVLETINPACWFAFFQSYIRDITHVRALHPDTLKYLLEASGFQRIDVRYRAPYPETQKLERAVVQAPDGADPAVTAAAQVAAVVTRNAEKMNGLLFTYQDYAAIGERL